MRESAPALRYEGEPLRKQVADITLAGLVVNMALVVLKGSAGVVGFSQALVADAAESASDLITSVMIILGARYWTAPADETHPYGHSRIETIITAFIALVIMATGVLICRNALISLQTHRQEQTPGVVAVAGVWIGIIGKEWLYRWTVRGARRIHSSALLAAAWHHRSDALNSLPVAVTIVISMVNPAWALLDHICAVVVALFIIHSGWKLMRPALAELSDGGVSLPERRKIEGLVQRTAGVAAMHCLRTRRSGAGIYVDLHMLVDGDLSVRQGHDIAESLKRTLMEQGPDVVDVLVHIEPADDAGE
ncbi:MAG: cation diffusion facilitator family transporter [Candidatus Omnitrophica bacterium]|nr:cation diffusion facilitator family transporter [Candidatus Omnitrophota bacterium]